MQRVYPLRFQPFYKHAIWGGRRLETVLGKTLGPGDDFAESWEIVDHGDDQSVVAGGPLDGMSLHQLVTERGAELLGRHYPQRRFPLLLKYLDAHRHLSIQVHPNDAVAAQMGLDDCGKTEAWVVLAAEPGSWIWAGLKRPVDREILRQAIAGGDLEQYVHRFQPSAGQCVVLPAGTVHALGEGLLVAEIQQASDLTFRLYDWGRMGSDGQPRELHIEEGLAAMDWDQGPVEPVVPVSTEATPGVERLVECDKFILDRLESRSPCGVGGGDRCHILTVLQGAIAIGDDPSELLLRMGQTVLLPAATGRITAVPRGETSAVVLDAYLP